MDLIINTGDILRLVSNIKINDVFVPKGNLIDVIEIDDDIYKLKVNFESKNYYFYAIDLFLFVKLSPEEMQTVKEKRAKLNFIHDNMFLETVNDIICPDNNRVRKGTRALVLKGGDKPVVLIENKEEGEFSYLTIVNKLDYKIIEHRMESVLQNWSIEKKEDPENTTFEQAGYHVFLKEIGCSIEVRVTGLDKYTVVQADEASLDKIKNDLNAAGIENITEKTLNKTIQIFCDYLLYHHEAFSDFKTYFFKTKRTEIAANNMAIKKKFSI